MRGQLPSLADRPGASAEAPGSSNTNTVETAAPDSSSTTRAVETTAPGSSSTSAVDKQAEEIEEKDEAAAKFDIMRDSTIAELEEKMKGHEVIVLDYRRLLIAKEESLDMMTTAFMKYRKIAFWARYKLALMRRVV